MLNMIVAAHQINFLPWIGYFIKMNTADLFILEGNVQFTKHGYSNRVKIKSATGEQWLTVPVITKGKGPQPLKEVKIDISRNWQQKHWKTLLVNYKRSKFFEKYSETIYSIYFKEWRYLIDLNLQFIEFIHHTLNLSTTLIPCSNISDEKPKDATQYIINLVKSANGNSYISGQSGKKYLREDKFGIEGIELKYISFNHPQYEQQFGKFIRNLSVIDLLFNEGPQAERIIKAEKAKIVNPEF